MLADDPYVQISGPVCQAGTILPGEVVTLPAAFIFNVSWDVPDRRDLLFSIELTTTGNTWHKDLILTANAPDLQVSQVSVDDEDGRLDPGDTAPLMITFRNSGHAAIDSVSAALFSPGPEVRVIDNPVQFFGSIGKGASVTRSYLLQASESAPNGVVIPLILSSTSSSGLQQQDSIDLKIGKTPALVVDMDPNNHSGPVIFSMLNELEVISEYESTVPVSMSDFQALFICLGYHNSNHVITYGEGQRLAGFLDNGGRIYMEGRKTWRDDPVTPVHPKFFLAANSTIGVYDTITGIEGTFTPDIELYNEASTPFSFYYLEPVPPAFNILQDNDNLQSCAVAYNSGIYKTIGALFELGTMSGIPPSSAMDLLVKYLEFFDIEVHPLGLEETSRETGQWRAYPNPASSQLALAPYLTPYPKWGRDGVRAGIQRLSVKILVSDISGRNVKDFSEISSFPFPIDISDLSPGMYIIRIVGEDGDSGAVKFLKIPE